MPITQEGMGKEVLELCFLNDARWQTVTSKCKNMKRWTQQTKIKEENAKKGGVERMAMRELLGSKSERAIICSWSKCRKEAGTARYEGDDQDFWQS